MEISLLIALSDDLDIKFSNEFIMCGFYLSANSDKRLNSEICGTFPLHPVLYRKWRDEKI